MIKISNKKKAYLLRKRNSLKHAELVKANNKKNRRYASNRRVRREPSELFLLKNKRSEFRKKFYKTIKYNRPIENINIESQFGIENNFEEFIKIASTFIDSRSRWVNFNLTNCKRMWPSAITLLCSFKQWTELTANINHIPKLSSVDPSDMSVNSYLSHCGFYDYVNTDDGDVDTDIYNDSEIVKIQRENNKSEIDEREESICEILGGYSSMTCDQIEDFDCNVLIEVFNNVAEHGTSYKDNGWWSLTQYHKTTGIISLCVADNGIGIKNSLITGPQKKSLLNSIKSGKDSDFIKAAFKENVSGALTGSKKKNRFIRTDIYERGSRRGNGLKRIKETCKRCGVAFSLLSQKGYVKFDSNGELELEGTEQKRVFAGTLYHFTIPAKAQS